MKNQGFEIDVYIYIYNDTYIYGIDLTISRYIHGAISDKCGPFQLDVHRTMVDPFFIRIHSLGTMVTILNDPMLPCYLIVVI